MAKHLVAHFDGNEDGDRKRLILQVVDDTVLIGGIAQPDLTNFGSVVIDLEDVQEGGADGAHADTAWFELKVREWDVCIDNGDGTTTRKKALFLSSPAYSPAGTSGAVTMTVAVGSAVSSGSVTGLALAFTPTKVLGLTVSGPPGGLVLVANHDEGTVSDDGFDYRLSGATDGSGYKLTFTLVE